MANDDQKRWREISRYFDEALELAEEARAAWLSELDERAPTISQAVRSLIAERDALAQHPLLNEERAIARPHGGLAGQRLGAYTLESLLGYGGMGSVWLASRSDGRFEGQAAVKILNAALLGRPAELRFVREGSVLAKLQHANIARLIDAGVAASGQPYLVLEHVEGERIDRYMEQRSLGVEARVRLFLDVLAAVAHAHSHLVVHRDIKPSNILVTAGGAVKLLDFGVAALLDAEDTNLTREAGAGLTPEYAAPEQLLNQPVTTATDVYALGLVLFVLLVGRHPLAPEGKSASDLARATLDGDTPRPSELARDGTLGRTLQGDLDNIVAKALRKEPQERYQTAEALAQDLRFFLAHQPVSARPASFAYRARKFIRRHRVSIAAAAIVFIVLAAATTMTTQQMLEARRQRDEALYQSRRAEFQARFAYQIMAEVGSDGKPMTIRQLMEKGIEILEKNYGDDPRFVISSLVNISGRYMNIGDSKGEYDAMLKAERIARELGDPERIAYVQCTFVETELALGRLPEARERLRDGRAHLAKLSEASFERRSDCDWADARLLWAEGRLPEAIEAATSIARTVETRGETNGVFYTTLASALYVMLAAEGRRIEAREWNQRMIAAIEKSGDATGVSLLNARHNQAAALYDAGEIRDAFDIQRSIVEQMSAQQGLESVAAGYAQRLGLYQVHVEETDAGLLWLDRAVSSAAARNDRRGTIGALLSRAHAHLLLGRRERVLADIEEVERLARDVPGENARALRYARLIRAERLLAGGEPAAALREIDANLSEVGYPQKRVANRLALMIIVKARAELALERTADALATARDALALAESNTPEPQRSATVGAALMVIAESLRATGDLKHARASAERAAVAFSQGLGPEHSETRRALQFQ